MQDVGRGLFLRTHAGVFVVSSRDTLYVDELLGTQTVNTAPPATIAAFMDHGKVAETLTKDVAGAKRTLEKVAAAGIDLDAVTDQLLREGLKAFGDAFTNLLAALPGSDGVVCAPALRAAVAKLLIAL
jgi:transaldolase/glucose-6-phosphate isomerase